MMCRARDSSYSRLPTSLNRSYLLVPMGVPLVDDVTRGEAARSSCWHGPGSRSRWDLTQPKLASPRSTAADHDVVFGHHLDGAGIGEVDNAAAHDLRVGWLDKKLFTRPPS